MPAQAKITKALERHVLAHAAAGKSTRWIASWIQKRYRKDISHNAVAVFLRAHRTEKADVAKAVVREELRTNLPRDLQVFDRRISALVGDLRRVEKASRDIMERFPGSPDRWRKVEAMRLKMLEQLRKCLDTKLHYVGADQPDEAIDGLADFLALAFKG